MKTDARLFSHLPGGVKIRSLLALAVILLVAWLLVESPLFHRSAPPSLHLTDLHSVSQFQSLFNADVGTPRLLLMLSPTSPTCHAGASWVRTELLEKYRTASVRVYAIWTFKLTFHSRDHS